VATVPRGLFFPKHPKSPGPALSRRAVFFPKIFTVFFTHLVGQACWDIRAVSGKVFKKGRGRCLSAIMQNRGNSLGKVNFFGKRR